MSLKKCIGIVSYFPDEKENKIRSLRTLRFTQLLEQLSNLWPTTDILIIAQNWKDFNLPKISNNTIINKFDQPLTIVGARNKLREEFLKLDYDYIIMLDDDAIIGYDTPTAADDYMKVIDQHPNGFCFLHSKEHWHTMDDYAPAPLNLCAISRFIYEKEQIPNMILENGEALEDDVYAVLLHIKYPEYEFLPPSTIRHTHFDMCQYYAQYFQPQKFCPSTWYTQGASLYIISSTTKKILDYIVENKKLPEESWWKK